MLPGFPQLREMKTETASGSSRSTDAAAIRKYCNRRNKVLANIALAIEPKLLYLIWDPTNPKEAWDKLQNTFQKKTYRLTN